MRLLTKTEIEDIALKVAAILKDRIDGDPLDPQTWLDAAPGLCSVRLLYGEDDGSCGWWAFAHDDAPNPHVTAWTSHTRPGPLARTLLHELSHAVLCHFAPEVFTETPWLKVENPYQAEENVCRAVERYFLGDFGDGWLPLNGFYWS